MPAPAQRAPGRRRHPPGLRDTPQHERLPEFLAWGRTVPRLLNGAETFAWNADKAYLVALGEQVLTVPTTLLAGSSMVVKPRVSASGLGLVVLEGGPWVVQPVVESVRPTGETSVFVLAGRAVSRFDKRPAAGELRVHEEYGGSTVRADLDPELPALAERAVAVAGGPPHTRVDLMRWQDAWVVSELELVERGPLPRRGPGHRRAVRGPARVGPPRRHTNRTGRSRVLGL